MSITIHKGSILDVKADVIVNPANSFLNHGGGLARVIAQTATAQWEPQSDGAGLYPRVSVLRAARDEYNARVNEWIVDHESAPLIPTGGVYFTRPGALPFKAVAHAVGPVWGGGGFLEHGLLESAHDQTLIKALHRGFKSVVFPAISCGIFGYPVDEAACVAVQVARWYEGELDVTFAVMEDEHVAAYTKALNA